MKVRTDFRRASGTALSVLLCTAALVAPQFANATHTALVAGTGQIRFGSNVFEVHVNAKSGRSGEDPQGHFFVRQEGVLSALDFAFRGQVNCLRFVGNEVTVSGEITHSRTPAAMPGQEFLLQIRDNGEPGAFRDFMSPVLVHPVGVGPDCLVPGEFDLVPLEQGNFIIHVHD